MTKRAELSAMLSWLDYLVIIGDVVNTKCNTEWREMFCLFYEMHPHGDYSRQNPYCLNIDSKNSYIWEYCFGPKLAYDKLVERAILEIHHLTNSDFPNGYNYFPTCS